MKVAQKNNHEYLINVTIDEFWLIKRALHIFSLEFFDLFRKYKGVKEDQKILADDMFDTINYFV